jgi:hypothetical protein
MMQPNGSGDLSVAGTTGTRFKHSALDSDDWVPGTPARREGPQGYEETRSRRLTPVRQHLNDESIPGTEAGKVRGGPLSWNGPE